MRGALAAALLVVACASPHVRPEAPPFSDVALDGDANGLLWDGGVLFVADSGNDRLLRWDGHDGFTVVAELPAAGRRGLGQPARLPDGSFLVPRFGHGETGGLIEVPAAANGPAHAREGLDPARKRIGVAVAADGQVYEAYHKGHGDGAGAVATVAADGTERDVVAGLGKPVGVQVHGEWLFFSDQANNELRRCRLPSCAAPERVAEVPGVDLFAVDRSGVLYVGTKDGSVMRIASDGRSEAIAAGLGRVRGVAVDDDGHRLFIAARSGERAFIRVMTLGR